MNQYEDDEELLDDVALEGDGGLDYISISQTHFIILSVLSLNLYCIWWMYKKWKFFKEKELLQIWPAVRAIFAIFFIYSLCEKIKRFAQKNACRADYSSGVILIVWIIASVLGNLDHWSSLFSVLVVAIFLQPLDSFNNALKKSDSYNLVIPQQLNGRQIGLIIVGLIFWIALISLYVFPEQFETY